MMEESSDESAEIISTEEAELAKKMQEVTELTKKSPETASLPVSTVSVGMVSPPAPLPSFMTGSGGKSATPQLSTGVPSQVTVQRAVSPDKSTPGISGVTALPQKKEVSPPAPVQSPYEANKQTVVPAEMVPETPDSPMEHGSGGLFGWFGGSRLMSKVVEKTKSGVESMITTLDPGMKEVIRTGGDVYIVVTSEKEAKVGAIREAFQAVFGKAIVRGMESQGNNAAQPVGYTSGMKGAEERIRNLRQKGNLQEGQPIVSVEGFIVEMLPDRWYEMSCILLQDPIHRVELQTFSQPTPIPAEYMLKAQDATSSDYPLRWSGLAKTIGQVVEESTPHIGRADWQLALTGISRRESLTMAAKSLAFMYKQRLPSSQDS